MADFTEKVERALSPNCKVLRFKDKADWKAKRIEGIGGSDVSAVMGKNPWKTSQELYQEKKHKVDNFKRTKEMDYGTNAEAPIRKLFKLRNQHLEVYHEDNVILQSIEYPMALYSPDGLIYDTETGKWGILEIKTSQVNGSNGWSKWENVPLHYYAQVLQGLLVTGFDFIIVVAEIKSLNTRRGMWEYTHRDYRIDKDSAVVGDIEKLLAKELAFWQDVQTGNEPGMIGGF